MTGEETIVEPEQVINAAGPWVGEVAALAGLGIEMLYSKGHAPGNRTQGYRTRGQPVAQPRRRGYSGSGGTVSLLGTTSVRIDSPDLIIPPLKKWT
jgi:glycerol-3-phosphate dehydrogenase